MRTTVTAPYAAYLRVYEPLEAFAEPERSRWARYAAQGAPSVAELTAQEHRRGLEALLSTPPAVAPPHEGEDAYVREAGGVTVVCPRRPRLRCWTALAELRREYPPLVVDAFWPRMVVEQATADHERWRAANPDLPAHILTSTWHVPVQWFVLFAPDEREPAGPGAADAAAAEAGAPAGAPGDLTSADVVSAEAAPGEAAPEEAASPGKAGEGEAGEGEAGGREGDEGRAGETGAGDAVPRLCYRTPMVQARRRVARALRVLRDTVEEGSPVLSLERLGRWLEEFHPRALVELDFGGLPGLMSPERLAAESSVEDVAEGLAALGAGDAEGAARAYARLTENWRVVRALEQAS